MEKPYLTRGDADGGDQERLLPTATMLDTEDSTPHTPKPKPCSPAIAALGVSIIINIGLIVAVVSAMSSCRIRDPQLDVWSPANHVVKYDKVVWYDNINHFSPWQLAPSDAVDELWSGLYSHTAYTLVDAASAPRLPNKTAVAPGTDGDGLVQLEVSVPKLGEQDSGVALTNDEVRQMFHALHCINALRKSLWPERYPEYSVFQNGVRDDTMTTHHAHCIERLRMNIMCAGNTGFNTFRWSSEASQWMINMEMTYMCRDFESIRKWAVAREFPDWNTSTPSDMTR